MKRFWSFDFFETYIYYRSCKAFSAERVFFARRGLTMFMSVALRFLENVCFVIKIFPKMSAKLKAVSRVRQFDL